LDRPCAAKISEDDFYKLNEPLTVSVPFRLPRSEPKLLEPSVRGEMVVLHVKSAARASASSSSSSPAQDGDEDTELLYECAASAAVADVAAALGALAGLQAALLSLCRRLRGERLYPETPCVVLVLSSRCGGTPVESSSY